MGLSVHKNYREAVQCIECCTTGRNPEPPKPWKWKGFTSSLGIFLGAIIYSRGYIYLTKDLQRTPCLWQVWYFKNRPPLNMVDDNLCAWLDKSMSCEICCVESKYIFFFSCPMPRKSSPMMPFQYNLCFVQMAIEVFTKGPQASTL